MVAMLVSIQVQEKDPKSLHRCESFDQRASDVADGDVRFLDALGIAGGDVEE
jgi:hypothetical protein